MPPLGPQNKASVPATLPPGHPITQADIVKGARRTKRGIQAPSRGGGGKRRGKRQRF